MYPLTGTRRRARVPDRRSYLNLRTDDTDVPEHFWSDNTPRLTEQLVEFAKD